MTYTAVLALIRPDNRETSQAIVDQLHATYSNEEFAKLFSYKKFHQWTVMTDSHSIVARYRKLQDEGRVN